MNFDRKSSLFTGTGISEASEMMPAFSTAHVMYFAGGGGGGAQGKPPGAAPWPHQVPGL